MDKFRLTSSSLPHLAPHCLAGQVILITGASKGIGRSLALAAAKHGATTILLGKSLKNLESVYDEIMNNGYPEPALHPVNLLRMDPKGAQELTQSIEQMFGRLDALVHNAGISGPITPFGLLSPEKWQEVIHLNLNVPYLLTHALLPLLNKTPHASILFTTAEEAYQSKAYWSAYSASKHGVCGLADALHEELENNTDIRVNCINPGKVRTALRINAYPALDPESFPTPESLMPYYLYLLSPLAKTIRGKQIDIACKAHEQVEALL
jgi:NAD(P)-dependent dehydrogenase (short-subunit alcohol dehydrogenase family)